MLGLVAADGLGGGTRRGDVVGEPMLRAAISTVGLLGEAGSLPLAFSVITGDELDMHGESEVGWESILR